MLWDVSFVVWLLVCLSVCPYDMCVYHNAALFMLAACYTKHMQQLVDMTS